MHPQNEAKQSNSARTCSSPRTLRLPQNRWLVCEYFNRHQLLNIFADVSRSPPLTSGYSFQDSSQRAALDGQINPALINAVSPKSRLEGVGVAYDLETLSEPKWRSSTDDYSILPDTTITSSDYSIPFFNWEDGQLVGSSGFHKTTFASRDTHSTTRVHKHARLRSRSNMIQKKPTSHIFQNCPAVPSESLGYFPLTGEEVQSQPSDVFGTQRATADSLDFDLSAFLWE